MPTENTNEPITETPTLSVPAQSTPAPAAEPATAEPAVPTESPVAEPAVLEPVAPQPVLSEEPKIPLAPFNKGGVIIDLLQKAKEKIQFRKRAKLEKIMALAQNKATANAGQAKISNNDVEKLLRVSDATATRYLAELVKQGRLRLMGLKKGSFYEIPR